jgi:hypothetical protein
MSVGCPSLSLDVIKFFHEPTMPYGNPMDKGKVWGQSVPEFAMLYRKSLILRGYRCRAKNPGSFPAKSARRWRPSSSP